MVRSALYFMRNLSVSFIITLVLVYFTASPLLGAPSPTGATNTAAPSAAAPKTAELFPDVAIVKAKSFEIKRSQLDDAVTSFKSTAVSRGQSIPPDQISMMEQQ